MDSRPKTHRARAALAGPGFTLIEVLVVVAIIALLLAILLPSLAKARWQTKVVACQAHLHDLGNGFQMYANTYAGFFPLTPDPSTDSFCALFRGHLLKDPSIVICPATSNVVRPETLRFAKTANEEAKSDLYYIAEGPKDASGGHSYEYNGCYNSDSGFSLSREHKKTTRFVLPPHDMMLVHDEDEEVDGLGKDPAFGCRPIILSTSYASGNNCPQSWDNHGETGMNMMFGDGHVQWTKKMRGTVSDMRDATATQIPPPKQSVNAQIEKVWLKSQYPWRYRQR
jgi:prepilin-type N-terminal cleavage/methylation domain-containing protein/prepilin-type processing-associated H-X9-DG protein